MAAADETGPFFHGTRARLAPGDLLVPGHRSNYRPEVVMRHVYVTALRDGAGLAAELAVELAATAGDPPADGPFEPHVYEVEPTGPIEDDPNVTDKKFPGNPTRSYRTAQPVRVVREVHDRTRLDADVLARWRERLRLMRTDPRAVIEN